MIAKKEEDALFFNYVRMFFFFPLLSNFLSRLFFNHYKVWIIRNFVWEIVGNYVCARTAAAKQMS